MNYDIKNCPHCSSNNCFAIGNENQKYGLVEIIDKKIVNINAPIPVTPIICKNCGHIELVHSDATINK